MNHVSEAVLDNVVLDDVTVTSSLRKIVM